MRTNGLLAILMLLALLAAPVALAERSDKARDAKAHEVDDDHREKADKYRGLDANATTNRTARMESFLDQVKSFHIAWKENATKIREDCKAAAALPDNATKEQREARAHCIHDGYAPWRAEHRADFKALRAEFKALMGSMGKRHERAG